MASPSNLTEHQHHTQISFTAWLASQERYASYPHAVTSFPLPDRPRLDAYHALHALWHSDESLQLRIYDLAWELDLVTKPLESVVREVASVSGDDDEHKAHASYTLAEHTSIPCLNYRVYGDPEVYASAAKQIYAVLEPAIRARTQYLGPWMVEVYDPDYMTDYRPGPFNYQGTARLAVAQRDYLLQRASKLVYTWPGAYPRGSPRYGESWLAGLCEQYLRRPGAHVNSAYIPTLALLVRAGTTADWDDVTARLRTVVNEWREALVGKEVEVQIKVCVKDEDGEEVMELRKVRGVVCMEGEEMRVGERRLEMQVRLLEE